MIRPGNCRFAASQSASPEEASPHAVNSETRCSYHERRIRSEIGAAGFVDDPISAGRRRKNLGSYLLTAIQFVRHGAQFAAGGLSRALNKFLRVDQEAVPDSPTRPWVNSIEAVKLKADEFCWVDDLDG